MRTGENDHFLHNDFQGRVPKEATIVLVFRDKFTGWIRK